MRLAPAHVALEGTRSTEPCEVSLKRFMPEEAKSQSQAVGAARLW
jgi:hypothetical protein